MAAEAVLDTSAIMAVLEDEPERAKVTEMLANARGGSGTIYAPFVALMEVEYKLLRRVGLERTEAAMSLLEGWPVQIVESNPSWRRQAAAIKSRGHLSLADAWMAGLAMLLKAELVHKDPEFDSVPGLKSARL